MTGNVVTKNYAFFGLLFWSLVAPNISMGGMSGIPAAMRLYNWAQAARCDQTLLTQAHNKIFYSYQPWMRNGGHPTNS